MKSKKKITKIRNKGFTLIELMITVAIVGILGTVALPAYQDYTIRSQVAEGLSLASGTKVQVAEYYANHGAFPEEMSDLGLVSSQGSFISATALGEGGAILATFGNDANKNILGGMVSLTPVETSKGNLEWTCESNIAEKYLPTSCKNNDSLGDSIDSWLPIEPIVRENGTILNPDGTITGWENFLGWNGYSHLMLYDGYNSGSYIASHMRAYNNNIIQYLSSEPGSDEEFAHGWAIVEAIRAINISLQNGFDSRSVYKDWDTLESLGVPKPEFMKFPKKSNTGVDLERLEALYMRNDIPNYITDPINPFH